MDVARPYLSAFSARFLLVLQYRAAAFAGFITQAWFGGVKAMVYAAFYASGSGAAAPISLSQTITYTWLAQALLALLPWAPDPDVVANVRTGGVAYDRLRPIDAYALWYVRALGWMVARALPRALMMAAFACAFLPMVGLSDWAWKGPANAIQGGLCLISTALALVLSAAMVMLINILTAATLNGRGLQILTVPVVILFSGNLVPLALFPDWARTAVLVQPFAGVFDIPCRIYFGALSGGMAWTAMGLQLFWSVLLIWLGHLWLEAVMRKLEVQGG